ncbi:MAG: DNRLRE domain-containing protein, partial [Caldilineales bacterium]|nr:DNRLRE domain-containing protein [Caldilineales bacterium]
MRRTPPLILALSLAATAWLATRPGAASGPAGYGALIDVPRTEIAPTLDGNLQEWSAVPTIVLDATTAAFQEGVPPYPSPADASLRLQLAWDDNNLYLAARVFDDILVNDSGAEVWKDDEIETGFDGNHNFTGPDTSDHQFTFNPDGRTTDFAVPTPLNATILPLADGWVVEAVLPLSAFTAEPVTPGKIIGFNFGLRDDDDGGTWDQKMIWQGTAIIDHWEQFGRLRFVSGLPSYTLVLSYGVNGFAGAVDSWIDAAQPSANFGNDDLLEIRASGQASSLLRFDLGRLPAHAFIQNATLSLDTQQRANASPLVVAAYRLRRPWQPEAVTWLQAAPGDPWQSPGGAGPLDRDPALISSVQVASLFVTYEWDVTSAARDWYSHPESNDGLLLAGQNGPQTAYAVHSAQSTSLDRRPKLLIDYVLLPITPPAPPPRPGPPPPP